MLADTVPYTGHTGEGRRVVVEVRGHAVVGVLAGIRHYGCDTFGEIGPLVVRETGRAAIGAGGRFRFAAGKPARRLTLTGRISRGRLLGTLRVQGTIATGQRCRSDTLRVRASR